MHRVSRSAGSAATQFVLWHWTDDPGEAAACAAAGVDRIGLDLDRLGKAERQPGKQSWISPHQIAALPGLRAALPGHCLFLRTNPLHPGSRHEVEAAIAAGVDILMLPNFQRLDQVADFVALVGGRAAVVPLVERRAALALLDQLPDLGIDEVHFGLNDLSIDFGAPNRLALLLDPEIEKACETAQRHFRRFGIGGVASPRASGLPVSARAVIAQHGRLGSSGAMLARSFWTGINNRDAAAIAVEIAAIRDAFAQTARHDDASLRALLCREPGLSP